MLGDVNDELLSSDFNFIGGVCDRDISEFSLKTIFFFFLIRARNWTNFYLTMSYLFSAVFLSIFARKDVRDGCFFKDRVPFLDILVNLLKFRKVCGEFFFSHLFLFSIRQK